MSLAWRAAIIPELERPAGGWVVRGLADTVQGELLRAVEKLRDEAQRNGNVN
jgi:hypothetical protein